MATDTKQILEKALALSPLERGALVDSLLASLDQPDARIDELWSKESEARLAAYEAGRMRAFPAEEVFAEFEEL
jgi:putative addiction module component (TIGR02574 family)